MAEHIHFIYKGVDLVTYEQDDIDMRYSMPGVDKLHSVFMCEKTEKGVSRFRGEATHAISRKRGMTKVKVSWVMRTNDGQIIDSGIAADFAPATHAMSQAAYNYLREMSPASESVYIRDTVTLIARAGADTSKAIRDAVLLAATYMYMGSAYVIVNVNDVTLKVYHDSDADAVIRTYQQAIEEME